MEIIGKVTLRHWRGEELLYEHLFKNLVTNAGLNLAVKRLGGVTADPVVAVAVGDSGTAPSATQAALVGTEITRGAMTFTATGNVLHGEATIGPFTSAVTVRELGIFTAMTSGIMFSRVTPVEFTMDPLDTVDVIWEIDVE